MDGVNDHEIDFYIKQISQTNEQKIEQDNAILQDGIIYKLDKINRISVISFPDSYLRDIFVPRSIVHQSIEYVVKRITPLSYINHTATSYFFLKIQKSNVLILVKLIA